MGTDDSDGELDEDDEGNEKKDDAATVLAPNSSGKRKAEVESDELEDECEKKAEAEIMYLNMYRTAVMMAASGDGECGEGAQVVAQKLLCHLNALPIFQGL